VVVPDPPREEPVTLPETWTGRVIVFERLIARSYPERLKKYDTGRRLIPRERVSGRLWIGNGYVWMKLDDNNGETVKGKWVAVRRDMNGDKFIQLDPQPEAPTIPPPVVVPAGLARVVWDDENKDFAFKCRTQGEGWSGPDNLPAVMRHPEARERWRLPREHGTPL
jgi:hypothetical protein